MLVTTRERLAVPGEALVELRDLPFAAPKAQATSRVSAVSTLSAVPTEGEAAERLFVQAARMARPNFKPSVEDMEHIRRICALADGMPLAIELAAAWVAMPECLTAP
jgi:predicted ATPase